MISNRRKAVSPVIATVILIAVAVALGIAVAFWASGLTSSFSKYEKLGVNTQYATGSGGNWVITLGGQNTGSSDASITQIQINGVPYTSYSGISLNTQQPKSGTSLPLSVPSGAQFELTLTLTAATLNGVSAFNDGQTIQVTIITAAGNNYPASIVLP
ncbi:MAG: archaellin/type IV pilin N-terminal domain-containing protein [Conexivisphaerales archaeon]